MKMRFEIATGVRDNEAIKIWAAKITGKDPKWGLKREWVTERDYETPSSKHNYYSFYFSAEEGDVVEVHVEMRWRGTEHNFFIVKNGELKKIMKNEVLKMIGGM